MMWSAFLAAIRFLTRVPAPDPGPLDERSQAASALFYPIVGLIVGLALWSGAALLGDSPPAVAAAILLLAWAWVTGGLHLDGLADTTDAWVGGIGDRERTLEIMKDPRIGVTGAVALIVILIAKWSALTALMEQSPAALLWLPALARTQLLLVFLTTPYAGSGGIAGRLAAALPRRAAWTVTASIWGACLLALGPQAWVAALAAAFTFEIWRRGVMDRLGGFTGDTAGALVELTETAMLLAIVLYGAG
jgi:adenosylcobinamide-GDP ribazoletransferase